MENDREDNDDNYISDYLIHCPKPRLEVITTLVEKGYSVNGSGCICKTPLYISQTLDTTRLFLRNGADTGYSTWKKGCHHIHPPSIVEYNDQYGKIKRDYDCSLGATAPLGYYHPFMTYKYGVPENYNMTVDSTDPSRLLGSVEYRKIMSNNVSTCLTKEDSFVESNNKMIRWYRNKRWSDFFTVI